eukprot:3546751-Heterocapsa_arctica.AAC.1
MGSQSPRSLLAMAPRLRVSCRCAKWELSHSGPEVAVPHLHVRPHHRCSCLACRSSRARSRRTRHYLCSRR